MNEFLEGDCEKYQTETRVGRGGQTREIIKSESQSLRLETTIGATKENISNNKNPSRLRFIIEDHQKLTKSLGNTTKNDNIISPIFITNVSSHFTVDNFRTYRNNQSINSIHLQA